MATDIPMVDAAPLNADLDADGKLDPPSVVEQWTAETLFNSQPMQKMLWSQKSRETFKDAEIDGKTFLERGHIEGFWRRDCGLPLGPSVELARLAQRIKGSASQAKRDERIKSENSGAVCDPKAIANYCRRDTSGSIRRRRLDSTGFVRLHPNTEYFGA
jgi:hypothetical protein